MGKSRLKFDCVLIREGDGFSALCLNVSVASQGDTPAKTKRALKDAVEQYLDEARRSSRTYIRPVSAAEDPRMLKPESILSTYKIGVDSR
jgi:hypothetical protein